MSSVLTRERRLLLAGVGLLRVAWVGFGSRSCFGRAKADRASTEAAALPSVADFHAIQAVTHDQEATRLQDDLDAARREVDRLKGEVARLQRTSAHSRVVAVEPRAIDAEAPALQPATDLSPLVAKQAKLIQAQDRPIQGLEARVHTLTLARDSWKVSDTERALQVNRTAHEAQVAALKAARCGGPPRGAGHRPRCGPCRREAPWTNTL